MIAQHANPKGVRVGAGLAKRPRTKSVWIVQHPDGLVPALIVYIFVFLQQNPYKFTIDFCLFCKFIRV